MRIAVDIMGGDKAPREIVAGCVDASRRLDELPGVEQIVMVGREEAMREELVRCKASLGGALGFVPASETIDMDEAPAAAVRSKKDNSLTKGMELVKNGEAQAMVSAGNSGAFAAAALFTLGRIKGVHRPVIATVLPGRTGRPIVVVDAGANADCKPEWLGQFAIMGAAYSEKILGAGEHPRVGLMSIGTEECKGNEFTHAAFPHVRDSGVNFVGNMEGHDILRGEIDVAVCDGFVGNIILKTVESTAMSIAYWLKNAIKSSLACKIGALFMYGSFKRLKKVMDPEQYGGAILLGVDGNCIVTHGSASRRTIFHAIKVAAEANTSELAPTIATRIAEHHARVETQKAAAGSPAAPETAQ